MLGEIISQTRYNDQTFSAASFMQSRLESSSFYGCTFVNCTLAESIFDRCRFVECTFESCDLSLVKLPASVFSGVHFEDSRLIGIDWTQVEWKAISLGDPLRFNKCVINHSTFIGLNLQGVKITETVAKDVDFREANLSGADFTGTDLAETLFSGTNLSGADLSGAKNYTIAAALNDLIGAQFSLPEALSLLYGLGIVIVEESVELGDKSN